MMILIENPRWMAREPGERSYWLFTARVVFAQNCESHIGMAGWKYNPAKGTVSSPSISSGKPGVFMNMTKVSADIYNAILEKAKETLGGAK